MTGATRPYRSTLRDEQARRTRRRIVDAGAALFVELGYTATTIDAIADRAGVSRRTVFTSVGPKPAVLKLAFDWTLAGDDEPVSIADRPETQRILSGDEPATILAQWMAMNAGINRRLAPLHRALLVAADTDDDAATLLATTDDQRTQGALAVVDRIEARGGLGPGLDRDQAAAVADMLIDPMNYHRLVDVHRWPFDTFVEHIQRIAVASLLR